MSSSTTVLLRSTKPNQRSKFWKLRNRFCDVTIVVRTSEHQNARTSERQNERTSERHYDRTSEHQNARTSEHRNARTSERQYAIKKRLSAHKIVLAASSNVLLKLLEDSNQIDLSHFDEKIVEHIIEFVYTGKTRIAVEDEAKFYDCALELKLEGLPMKWNNKKKLIPRTEKIEDLPTEILLKIINYVPMKDVQRNVSLVSKQMNLLSNDSSVGVVVEFTKNTTLAAAQNTFKKMANRILALYFNSGTKVEIIKMLFDQISTLTMLNKLVIWNAEVPIPTSFLAQLSKLKKLRFLTLELNFEETTLRTIVDCKKLKSLVIKPKFYSLSDADLKALEQLGKRTQLFVDLTFSNLSQISRAASSPIEFPMAPNNSLQHHLVLYVESVSELELIVSHFPHVHQLQAYGKCDLESQENIRSLHSLLSKCKNLFHLLLKCSRIDEAAFRDQFKGWNYTYDQERNDIRIYR
jgi:hypothetical protein